MLALRNHPFWLHGPSRCYTDNHETVAHDFSPSVDIVEGDDAIYLRADLPGVSNEDIQLEVEDNQLYVRGKKSLGALADSQSYVRRERSEGTFSRVFRLGSAIDLEKIEASFKDGVLEVKLPRTAEAKPRRIDIN